MQPEQALTLFNSLPPGGEWTATILSMGRRDVEVRVDAHTAIERETARPIHLAIGMPANDRMDTLVEKAVELGIASIQPLIVERSVLRLQGERAAKKVAHWQAIAQAACEQCGRNQVPLIHAIQTLPSWLTSLTSEAPAARYLLSLSAQAQVLPRNPTSTDAVTLLCGAEGGWSAQEELAALQTGFLPFSLGQRVLRSDTAPLAALAILA